VTALLETNEARRLARRQFSFWDDFYSVTSGQLWTVTASDSGGVTVGDAHGGIATLEPSDGSIADNDETYLLTTHELFLLGLGNTQDFGGLIKFTEANTDDANVMFGVMNAVGANTILDDGGGPKSSFSGAVFYKIDGATTWRVRSSVGTSYTDTSLPAYTAGGSYQLLGIRFEADSLTHVRVNYFINGVPVLDPNFPARPLEHVLDATSATEMQLFAGQKNGANTNHEFLLIDGMGWGSIR
jgi:hypothetical protein